MAFCLDSLPELLYLLGLFFQLRSKRRYCEGWGVPLFNGGALLDRAGIFNGTGALAVIDEKIGTLDAERFCNPADRREMDTFRVIGAGQGFWVYPIVLKEC